MIQLGWVSYTVAKRYVNVQTNKKNAPFGSKVVRRYFYVILLQFNGRNSIGSYLIMLFGLAEGFENHY
jgi:hypothetical protein